MPPLRPRPPRRPLLVLSALLVAGALALTGCSTVAGLLSRGGASYEDKKEAMAAGSSPVPDWVPEDAKAIRLAFPAEGPGYLMAFTSKTGVRPGDGCAVAPAGTPVAPPISADWWPRRAPTDDRRTCGSAEVARAGGTWYAWVKES